MNEVEEKVPLINGERIFIKATGANRYSGGTPNWLLIRGIKKKDGNTYEIRVQIGGKDMFVDIIDPRYGVTNLKFALKSGKEVKFDQILKNMGQPYQLSMFKESRSKRMGKYLSKLIHEEVTLAIEDLIRPLTEKTITSDIAGQINSETNKFIKTVLKTSFISSGAVAFVEGTDGQQYEIVVRPLRLGQFKDMVSDVKNELKK